MPVVVVSPPVVFQPSMVVVVVMIEFHGDPVVFIVAPHHRIIVVRGITDHRGIAEQPRNVGRISHVTYSEATKCSRRSEGYPLRIPVFRKKQMRQTNANEMRMRREHNHKPLQSAPR